MTAGERTTAIDPAPYASLGELLFDALVMHKREIAMVEVDRTTLRHEWTGLDVRHEVARVVAFFEACGVRAGDRVAIVMSNQSRWLVAAIAIFHRGAVLVPIDMKLSGVEQAELLQHSGARTLVVEHALLRRIPALPASITTTLVSEGPDDPWGALPDAALHAPAPRTRADDAAIVYSSGTGGRPKGCVLSHGAYLSQLGALMSLFPMRPGHRFFSVLPTNHAIDFMVGFVGPLSCGAAVVHQRTLRPEFFGPTFRTQHITHVALVPSLLESFERALTERLGKRPVWQQAAARLFSEVNQVLTEDAPRPEISRRLLSSIHAGLGGALEQVYCGGAFVDRARAERLYRLGLPVVIGYGLTECCTVATVNDLRPFRADSVGRPLAGIELRIERPDAEGVGEVWVRGPTLMTRYEGDPELTAETIDAEGWLHTGDLGRLDASSHLHLVGRAKNMVVTAGGKNVYPEDVESHFEGLPCEELVVLASGYVWPRHGKLEDEVLFAAVRLGKHSHETARRELAARNRRLPEHKRITRWLVVRDAFPRTASLKVKRKELAESLRTTPVESLRALDVERTGAEA